MESISVSNVSRLDKIVSFSAAISYATSYAMAFAVVIDRGIPQREWAFFVLIAAGVNIFPKVWSMRNEANPLEYYKKFGHAIAYILWVLLFAATGKLIHWGFYLSLVFGGFCVAQVKERLNRRSSG